MTTQNQEQRRTNTTRTAPPPVTTGPIDAAARAYRASNGDPSRWTARQHEVYAELGGIQ
ncbi:hypothetical protein AB0D04_16105 [Streptomyces sp. NPDC048483]|uniref:hypothetical protein n=1 Tax=Streptomyces sp. NPDC048483 TaxID=3154927 RepID=UPI00341AE771